MCHADGVLADDFQLDPTRIEAVLFDVGGVFLIPDAAPLGEHLRAAGLEPDLSDAALRRAHFHGAFALAEASQTQTFSELNPSIWSHYRTAQFEQFGIATEDVGRANTALDGMRSLGARGVWRRVLEENVAALRRIGDGGVPVAIVSNNDGTVEQQLIEHGICQIGPGDGTDVLAITDSEIVGVAKPDPRIFDDAIAAVGVPRDRIAYVGDTEPADVVGARAAGMVPVHLDPFELHGGYEHIRVRNVGDLAGLLLD